MNQKQLSIINDVLSNDEVSTDEELKKFLMEEAGISEAQADKAISFRDEFLVDIGMELSFENGDLVRSSDKNGCRLKK